MKKTDLFVVFSLASVALLTARVYPNLSKEVVTHFDIHGEPNGSMSRPVFAVFCPLLAIGTWLFYRFLLPLFAQGDGPKRSPYGMSEASYHRTQLLTLSVILGVHLFLLRYAMVPDSGRPGSARLGGRGA